PPPPGRHPPAVARAGPPALPFPISREIGAVPRAWAPLGGGLAEPVGTLKLLPSGFITTAVLWGAAAAELIDGRFRRSALFFFAAAVLCLFGVIHSPAAQGTLFLPWQATSTSCQLAAAYALPSLGVFSPPLLRGQ